MTSHVVNWIVGYLAAWGVWGIGVEMAIESAAIPLPSEVILPFAGYLVFTGKVGFAAALWAAIAGGLAGSVVSYYVGAWGGRPLLARYGRYVFISPHGLSRAEDWFQRYGEATVFFGRLVPGVRTFISLPAGIARMPLMRFIVYSALGSLPWSAGLMYVGYKLGENWQIIEPLFHRLDLVVVAVVVLVLLAAGWRAFFHRH